MEPPVAESTQYAEDIEPVNTAAPTYKEFNSQVRITLHGEWILGQRPLPRSVQSIWVLESIIEAFYLSFIFIDLEH